MNHKPSRDEVPKLIFCYFKMVFKLLNCCLLSYVDKFCKQFGNQALFLKDYFEKKGQQATTSVLFIKNMQTRQPQSAASDHSN